MVDAYISVVVQEPVSCGTLLGPLPLSSSFPDSLSILIWRCVDKVPMSKQILKVTLKDQTTGKAIRPPSWLIHVQSARNPEEQTLEVVAKGGQLYYRAQRDISAGEELKVWFSSDLADLLRLPLLPPNTVEGIKDFDCVLCHEKFENPFPVVAHLMYRCHRRDNELSEMTIFNQVRRKKSVRVKNFNIATLTGIDDCKKSNCETNANVVIINNCQEEAKVSETTNSLSETKEYYAKKRRKKIYGDDRSPTSSKRIKSKIDHESVLESTENKPDNELSQSACNLEISAFKITGSVHSLGNLNCKDSVLVGNNSNNSSAFKKVDKSSFTRTSAIPSIISPMTNLISSSLGPRELIFPQNGNSFSPFAYPPVVTSPTACTLPQTMVSTVHHSVLNHQDGTVDTHMPRAFANNPKPTSSLASLTIQSAKLNEDFKMLRGGSESSFEICAIPSGLRIPTISGVNYSSKPIQQGLENYGSKPFPTPLLPFLPPSLAALSFPTQNWCAKCNASFRMTSDLVYHMRSHHKRETDPQKIKREEKLRCHICHESFRERHHLTRHMTSHQ